MGDSPKTAVIGGGITGLFIARELASEGHSVVLFEKGSLGNATSNNSLRIIHGGFRYLQHLELGRVISSRNDQRAFKKEFGDLTRPLRCYMPIKRFGIKSKPFCKIAAWLFKLIASESEAAVYSVNELPEKVVGIGTLFKYGALSWNDLLLADPKGVVERLRSSLLASGVSILEGCPVSKVEKVGSTYSVTSSRGDKLQREDFRYIVNAAGPWASSISFDGETTGSHKAHNAWCRGFNLIVNENLSGPYGIAIHGRDRLFFIVPREKGSAIGTWYVPCSGSDDGEISARDLSDFLKSFNEASPFKTLNPESVTGIESGVLPLASCSPRTDVLRLSQIHIDSGYIEVISTKYTEARSLAKRVARAIPS